MSSGTEPNVVTFSAMIDACAKAGSLEKAEKWHDKMEDCGIIADVVIYSTMLDAAAKVNDIDQAMGVFKRMKSKGVRPNVISYAALARPFAHRGNYRQVEHF